MIVCCHDERCEVRDGCDNWIHRDTQGTPGDVAHHGMTFRPAWMPHDCFCPYAKRTNMHNTFENATPEQLEMARQLGLDIEGCEGCENLWLQPCCNKFICIAQTKFGKEYCIRVESSHE